ncbi:ArsR family transcriptional regulator [Agrobacterium vitis]|nr:ArsR family transcriptional regulator [Agrobacterium vitis]MBE1439897.1 ArsR family transcriptional regulator [Agrobacterium vitis]
MISSLTDENAPLPLADFMRQATDAVALLKALSHENRLLILCILCKAEKTVGELEEILQLQQAIVSQQLARLRADGLVESRREGRQIYYSIANPLVEDVVALLYRLYCDPKPSQLTQPEL